MPRLSITALINTVMVQDPYPATGKVVIEATTAGTVHRTVEWSQLQRIMPKLVALEAAREIDFSVTASTDDPRGAELGLAGLPAVSYLTEGSGPIVPGAALTTDHILTGVNFLAGQSQAQVRLGSATLPNDAILIRAIQPGPDGADYTVAITDNGGGATTFAAGATADDLIIDTDVGVTTFAVLAAEINALAGVGAYAASAVPLEAELPGTGAGLVAVTAETALVGGAGPGLTMTVGGVAADISWVDILGTNVRFGINLSGSGPAASSSVISAVLRAGKQITALDIPLLASALQFKGSIAVAADFPLVEAVQPGWMYRITADVTDNAGLLYTNTGQSFLAQSEIAWNGTDWSELGTEAVATFVTTTPITLAEGDGLVEVDTVTLAGASIINLPAAAAGRVGKTYEIVDVNGAAAAGAEIAVTPDGTDTIDGINAAVDINEAYGGYTFTCVQTGAATYGWVTGASSANKLNNSIHESWQHIAAADTLRYFRATSAGRIVIANVEDGTVAAAAESMTFDVQIGGVSCLTGLITLDNGDSIDTPVAGVVDVAANTFAAGDLVRVVRAYVPGGAPTPMADTVCTIEIQLDA